MQAIGYIDVQIKARAVFLNTITSNGPTLIAYLYAAAYSGDNTVLLQGRPRYELPILKPIENPYKFVGDKLREMADKVGGSVEINGVNIANAIYEQLIEQPNFIAQAINVVETINASIK